MEVLHSSVKKILRHKRADFYQLPRNADRIELVREPWRIPDSLPYLDEVIVPFMAGEQLHWRLAI